MFVLVGNEINGGINAEWYVFVLADPFGSLQLLFFFAFFVVLLNFLTTSVFRLSDAMMALIVVATIAHLNIIFIKI